MFKIILKNLWRRRKANGWLFAELVIITALMWFIIDPVVVVNYDLSLPLGYDSDRLVTVDFNSLREQSPKYNGAADSADVRQASVQAIYNRLRSIKGVESVTYLGEQLQINGGGISIRFSIPAIKQWILLPGRHLYSILFPDILILRHTASKAWKEVQLRKNCRRFLTQTP